MTKWNNAAWWWLTTGQWPCAVRRRTRPGLHQNWEPLQSTIHVLWKMGCIFFTSALEQAVSAAHSLRPSQQAKHMLGKDLITTAISHHVMGFRTGGCNFWCKPTHPAHTLMSGHWTQQHVRNKRASLRQFGIACPELSLGHPFHGQFTTNFRQWFQIKVTCHVLPVWVRKEETSWFFQQMSHIFCLQRRLQAFLVISKLLTELAHGVGLLY